eukprot:Sdes_comp20280_c0_seq1m13836
MAMIECIKEKGSPCYFDHILNFVTKRWNIIRRRDGIPYHTKIKTIVESALVGEGCKYRLFQVDLSHESTSWMLCTVPQLVASDSTIDSDQGEKITPRDAYSAKQASCEDAIHCHVNFESDSSEASEDEPNFHQENSSPVFTSMHRLLMEALLQNESENTPSTLPKIISRMFSLKHLYSLDQTDFQSSCQQFLDSVFNDKIYRIWYRPRRSPDKSHKTWILTNLAKTLHHDYNASNGTSPRKTSCGASGLLSLSPGLRNGSPTTDKMD